MKTETNNPTIPEDYNNIDPTVFALTYLYPHLQPESMPIFCSQSGDPKLAQAWTPSVLTEDVRMPSNANLYICISSVNRDEQTGQYRARVSQVAQTHMFLLDDIGDETTAHKPDFHTLPLTPTWVIETSPHNYQALYVLYEPMSDLELADRITKTLPGEADSDKGAVNLVRWARLPGGINNKAQYLDSDGQGYPVTIKDANPDCLYKPEEIIAGFGLPIDISESRSDLDVGHSGSENTQENTQHELKGVQPEGWARHVSCLNAIDPDCDYDTWFKCAVVMHAWGEQGRDAFVAWSAKAKEKYDGEDNAISKFNSVQYDSRNPQGNKSVVSYPWLEATARRYGWDYNKYSLEEAGRIREAAYNIGTPEELNVLVEITHDAFLSAQDLDIAVREIHKASQRMGLNVSLPALRKSIITPQERDPEAEEWTYSLTDVGNLDRAHALYNGILHQVQAINGFYLWDETKKKWVYKDNVQNIVLDVIDKIPELEDRIITADEHRQLQRWQQSCRAYKHVSALRSLITNDTSFYKPVEQFNTHKTRIGTLSGVCDLESGVISNNTPQHYITMQTRFDWNEESICPRWEQFMNEIMDGDTEMVNFMQKLSGYSIFGGNPEQLFVILEGHGSNGKSVFVKTLEYVMGDYAATASSDTLMRPAFNRSSSGAAPDLIRLFRKRLVICNEWPENSYINEPLIKVLAGGADELAVRSLYSNTYLSYVPEFLIMLATNHRPNIAGMDYGIWRRLLIIPFEVNFSDPQHISKRDVNLEDYFKENEGPGILNWLIEGYHMWRAEGFSDRIPQKLLEVKAQYRQEMDTVGEFLNEMCEYTNVPTDPMFSSIATKSSDIHRAYANWCAENGHKAKGMRTLSASLTQRGFTATRVNTARGFKGIRLLSPAEIAAQTPHTLGLTEPKENRNDEAEQHTIN